MVNELEIALKEYRREYKRFPKYYVLRPKDWTGRTHHELLSTLMALSGSEETNERGIKFFEADDRWLSEDGGKYRLNDPWGRPYYVVFDGDYDGEILIPEIVLPNSRKTPVPVEFGSGRKAELRVAVWSAGPDGESGTVDDITSY